MADARAALRESEQKFRDLIEGSVQGILVHRDFRVLFANPALASIWGYPDAASMLGLDLIELLPESYVDFWRDGYRRVMQGGQVQNPLEVQIFRPAGEAVWVERIHRRVMWEGEPALQATLTDISARKQGELALRNALAELEALKNRLEQENRYLQSELEGSRGLGAVVGTSPPLRRALERAHKVAQTTATVLIQGETGAGKDVLARAVHEASPRRDRPLIALNCAALPAQLIDSELFGHEKGAFTGAAQQRIGRFELAHEGTLFLDEVGELPMGLQAKLLRVLQEGTFERLGSTTTTTVDVRVIAATNRDLSGAVREGRFREDLYYRLNVFPIHAPPLRERKQDIAPLVHHFMTRYAASIGREVCRVPPEVMARLETYAWPGNVRELQNVIERSVILSPGPELALDTELEALADDGPVGDEGTLREIEARAIRRALDACDGVIEGPRGAARRLDLKPSTLRERMRKHGVERRR